MYKDIDLDKLKCNNDFRWYLERENFFSKDECEELIEIVDKEAVLKSGFYRGTEDRNKLNQKDNTSCFLNFKRSKDSKLLDRFWNAIKLADLTTYHYNCKGIYGNGLSLHRYDVGQYYTPHSDFHWIDKYSVNKLTCVVFLNDDYEGGEFHFFDGKVIEPKVGKLIIHPAFAGHGVKPVKKGSRYSCLAWGVGDTFV